MLESSAKFVGTSHTPSNEGKGPSLFDPGNWCVVDFKACVTACPHHLLDGGADAFFFTTALL